MKKQYFKDVIKAYRISNNLTQRDFANILQVPYQTIQKYEYGTREPNFRFFLKFHNAFPDFDINKFFDVSPLSKE